jgi:hypothetical protein
MEDIMKRDVTIAGTRNLVEGTDAVHPADRQLEVALKGRLARSKRAPGPPRVVVVLDATASWGEYLPERKLTIEAARAIAYPLFEKAGADRPQVQFVFFRGHDGFANRECKASRWFSDPEALAQAIAQVEHKGGWTQHCRALAHAIKMAEEFPVDEVVIVTDAFEQRGPRRPDGDVLEDARTQAMHLRALGVNISIAYKGTIQGGCPLDRAGVGAEEAFRSIASANGGSCFLFDPKKTGAAAKRFEQIAAHATCLAKGDAAGAQVLLAHMQSVPFSMDPVGVQVSRCGSEER